MRPFEETHYGSDQPRTPDLAAMYRSCSYKDVRRLGIFVSHPGAILLFEEPYFLSLGKWYGVRFSGSVIRFDILQSSSSLPSSGKASGSVSYYKIPPFNVFETVSEFVSLYREQHSWPFFPCRFTKRSPLWTPIPRLLISLPCMTMMARDIVSLLILDEGDHPDQGQSTRRRSGQKANHHSTYVRHSTAMLNRLTLLFHSRLWASCETGYLSVNRVLILKATHRD